MELTEPVELINQQLKDSYGIDTITGLAMWRVVWSEDQFEHRLGTYDDYSPAGLYLRTVTEVRLVPKYRQWIQKKYVLENLVVVPEEQQNELPDSKVSYEPIYVFQTGSGEYLPPKLEAAKFIISSIYAVKGKGSLTQYKDPETTLKGEDLIEYQTQKIDELQAELFGNESYVGDALAHKQAVIVPRNYKEMN